jgi:hypothetical protein
MRLIKPQKLRIAIILAGLIVFAGFCVFNTTQMNSPSPTSVSQINKSSTDIPTKTVEETQSRPNTPEPTNKPTPTATLPPEDALRTAILDALKDKGREISRLKEYSNKDGEIGIKWIIYKNFSEELTKIGAELDIYHILLIFSQSDVDYKQLTMTGTYTTQDAYKNYSELNVVTVLYLRDTIDKINWDDFPFNNVYSIADEVILHPTFK